MGVLFGSGRFCLGLPDPSMFLLLVGLGAGLDCWLLRVLSNFKPFLAPDLSDGRALCLSFFRLLAACESLAPLPLSRVLLRFKGVPGVTSSTSISSSMTSHSSDRFARLSGGNDGPIAPFVFAGFFH